MPSSGSNYWFKYSEVVVLKVLKFAYIPNFLFQLSLSLPKFQPDIIQHDHVMCEMRLLYLYIDVTIKKVVFGA